MAPIDRDQEIRDRAYHLWKQAGQPFGREHEFWAAAIREIEGKGIVDTPPARNVAR